MSGEKENNSRSDAALIETAIRQESKRRLKAITLSRTGAMVAVAAVVATVAPWPDFLYYHGLIVLFIISGVLQFLIGRSSWAREWFVYLFVALDMALLVFTLIYPNPFSSAALPPQIILRFGNFIYLFLVIGVLAITLKPALPLWGGITGALFWAIGVAWLASLPDSVTEPLQARSPQAEGRIADLVTEGILDPNFIDLGVQFQNIVVFLLVAVMISVATETSRRLLIRETGQARRVANLSRYLPAEAIADLELRDDPFAEERQADVAVLFTDIVNFSALAEAKDPHEVITLLREVHQVVERAVFEHGGVLDKFIGDGAMATFGATRASGDLAKGRHPARNGIDCVQAILSATSQWSADRKAKDLGDVRVSVGLHYGPVVVGDVGSARRTELAVIGDTVNVASRLESMTRELDVAACISDEAIVAAGSSAGIEKIGPHPVKGRAEPITIWAPVRAERNSGGL